MNAIALKNYSNIQIEIIPEAFQRKAEILADVKLCPEIISDEFGEQVTVEALSEVKKFRREFEKSRKDAKDEPLKTGREIDRKSSDFDADLEKSQLALEGRLSARDKEKRRIAQEAENKRLEELRKIQAEQDRIALESRLAQEEINRKLNEAKTVEEAKKTVEIQRQQQVAFEAQREEANKRAIANVTAPVVASQKIEGTTSKVVDDYEVLNIHLVYKNHPELVTMTIKRADTLMAIKLGMKECEGLRIFSDVKSTAK